MQVQYILTQEEIDHYKEIEEKYNELIKEKEEVLKAAKKEGIRQGIKTYLTDFPVHSLANLITVDNRFRQLPDRWLWKPIDGKVYLYSHTILKEFREQLEKDINTLDI